MKLLITFFATVLISLTNSSDVKEYLGVGGPIVFNGESFHLKWSSKQGNYYIQEYLTDNDSLPRFNEMISLFVLNENISIKDAVQAKIAELDAAKKIDPVCNYAVTEAEDKTIILDFLRGESVEGFMTIVEFNVYRYKQIKLGKNKKAIAVYAYSKRAYEAAITPFLKSLVKERPVLIDNTLNTDLPEIRITN